MRKKFLRLFLGLLMACILFLILSIYQLNTNRNSILKSYASAETKKEKSEALQKKISRKTKEKLPTTKNKTRKKLIEVSDKLTVRPKKESTILKPQLIFETEKEVKEKRDRSFINESQKIADISEQEDKLIIERKEKKAIAQQKNTLSNREPISVNLKHDKLISKNPLVETDQSRYLLAIAHNGPTNQLLGLREAIFLSIRMNRTLILPKFFKVSIDRSSKIREVPAEYRFDLSSLSNLVPFEFNNKSQEICENGLEVLLTRETCSFINKREKFVLKVTQSINIAFPTNPSDGTAKYVCSDDKISYPFLSQDYSKYKCIGFAFYDTERRVSVRSVRSARSILDNYKLKGVKTSTTSLNDATLYALSFLSTGLPLLVKNLVKKFVNKYIPRNSWLAIHWRYNLNDWMQHCSEKKPENEFYQPLCSKLKAVLPKDILYAGITVLEQAATHTENDISTIYVATPLNQKTIIDGIEAEYLLIKKQEQRKRKRKNKKNNKAINVLTSVTLNNFLETQKHLINDNFYNDVIALVEMELCIESTLFLYSQRSSWSQNVLKERVEKKTAKLDQEIVSRAWEEHVHNEQ